MHRNFVAGRVPGPAPCALRRGAAGEGRARWTGQARAPSQGTGTRGSGKGKSAGGAGTTHGRPASPNSLAGGGRRRVRGPSGAGDASAPPGRAAASQVRTRSSGCETGRRRQPVARGARRRARAVRLEAPRASERARRRRRGAVKRTGKAAHDQRGPPALGSLGAVRGRTEKRDRREELPRQAHAEGAVKTKHPCEARQKAPVPSRTRWARTDKEVK